MSSSSRFARSDVANCLKKVTSESLSAAQTELEIAHKELYLYFGLFILSLLYFSRYRGNI